MLHGFIVHVSYSSTWWCLQADIFYDFLLFLGGGGYFYYNLYLGKMAWENVKVSDKVLIRISSNLIHEQGFPFYVELMAINNKSAKWHCGRHTNNLLKKNFNLRIGKKVHKITNNSILNRGSTLISTNLVGVHPGNIYTNNN